MPISQTEFDAMMADTSKHIDGDLRWRPDEDHSPGIEFRAEVLSDAGYPLFAAGRFNRLAGKTSFSLIHKTTGRVYGLCLGSDHHNPTCERIGERHKHLWTDANKDKWAYVPPDVSARAEDPVGAWQEFCREAGIDHRGQLAQPGPAQEDLPL